MQVGRELGFEEAHDEFAALLPNVDAGFGAGQLNDDAPFAFGAAPEVDVFDDLFQVGRAGFEARGARGGCGRCARYVGDVAVHALNFDFGVLNAATKRL